MDTPNAKTRRAFADRQFLDLPEDVQRRVTQPEAARLLGNVSLMTMWRWRHDPEMQFPESIEINNRIYFRRSEILAWRPPPKASSSPASRFKSVTA
jgi:predicted DNA-binding transcriptional regulator AlpA